MASTADQGTAAGVVKVRLSGDAAGIEAAAAALAAACEVVDRSAPYPNRREAGVRVYLTLRPGQAPPGPRP